MTNPLRGQVAFEAGDTPYVLRLGLNEMISLMTAWGIPPNDLEQLFQRLQELRSFVVLREVVLHALKRDKPQLTLEEAGDVITQVGFDRMGELIMEAIRWALPEPQEDQPEAGDGGDPKGVGISSAS